jgi:voltage-gated potassium channel
MTVPGPARRGDLLLPRYEVDPIRAILLRAGIGCAILLVIAVLVWLDADAYSDVDDDVTFLDAVYYATVSASTTGFGDIAPETPQARLVNIVLITPLRVAFLGVLIGTTLEVLTRTGRERLRVARWQRRVHDHTVIVGFGTKGRAAADRLLRDGTPASSVVTVTDDPELLADAADRRIVAVEGDGSRDDVLLAAVLDKACCVIIAVPLDATAILVCLTARRLNPTARIVGAVKELENAPLLRASGADSVLVSAGSTGRQLAASLASPTISSVYGELLDPGQGIELTERPVAADEVGRLAGQLLDLVVGIVRDGRLHRELGRDLLLRDGDRLVLIRPATQQRS